MSLFDQLPSEKDMKKLAQLYAKTAKYLFDALKTEGFTEKRAFQIILKQETMFKVST